MAPARQPWPYESLAGCEDTFRLLALILDEDHEPLRCLLSPKPLDNPPNYHALSYVWGDPRKEETIIVFDNYFCEITASLASALRDVRTNRRNYAKEVLPAQEGVPALWVWCDGICINQTDLAEKEDQVTLMGSIYRRADTVFIHTGAEIPGLQDFPSFMDRVYRWSSREWKTKWSPAFKSTSPEDAESEEVPPADDIRWLHLKSFLYQPWPRRSWITQEAVLAKRKPVLLYGPYGIGFDKPTLFLNYSSRGILPKSICTFYSDEDDRHIAMVGALTSLVHSGGRINDGSLDVTLNELLYHCYDSACSDPRDKIYSLANLASDWSLLDIEINYSVPAERLYKAVAAKLLKSSGSLLILATVGAKQMILPSWNTRPHSYVFSAGGDELEITHVDDEEGTLTLRAADFDRISFVSDIVDVREEDPLQKFKNCIEIYEQMRPGQCYLNGQSVKHATGLTWIAGRNSTFKRITMDTFLEWLNAWYDSNGDFDDSRLSHPARLRGALKEAAHCRRWAITKNGQMGLVPGTAQVEDNVYIVPGAQTPFIIRERGPDNVLVGECYIHGIMDREAFRSGSLVFRDIRLI